MTDVTIGGATAGARNVISGNSFVGIRISNSFCGDCVTDNVVQGNYIGTDLTGTLPLGNGIQAININTIGNDVLDNVISGNLGDGVVVGSGNPADGALVQGNKIGTDVTGTLPVPNLGWGVRVQGGNVQIGGTAPGDANTIAYNGTTTQGGVFIEGGSGNAIRHNLIHDNVGLGIDLFPIGVNPNDELDGDTGQNDLQNFPVISSVTNTLAESPEGGTRVQGFLHSKPSTTYALDVFANDACVRFPKDFLEGKRYLGSGQVTTDGFGEGVIDVSVPLTTQPGERVSLTATDPAGSTSEFSQRLPFSINPASGPSAGGTGVTIAGTDFEDGATVTIGGQPATSVVVTNFNQMTAVAPALAAGSLNDVVVTNTEGTTGTLEKGFVADFLDVPPAQQFYTYVTTLVTNAITAGIGGGLYGVDQPTLRQQMAVFLLKAKVRPLLRSARLHGRLPRRALPFDLRELDRGPRGPGHYGRLRRRQLLPAKPGPPGPDGGVPPEGQVRILIRAAGMHRRLPRCPLPLAVRRLDRAARRGEHHGRLRRRQLLSALEQHARPDGGLHSEDVQSAVTGDR